MKEAKETGEKEEQAKLQQEMMGLYTKHGVNPINMGCLPLIIQMPIIMGLYFAILAFSRSERVYVSLVRPWEARYDYDGDCRSCLFRSGTRVTLDDARPTKEADENVHLFVTNNDYVHFVPSNVVRYRFTGRSGDSSHNPNISWTEIVL